MLTAVVVVYSGGAFVDALITPEAKLVEHKDPTEDGGIKGALKMQEWKKQEWKMQER